MSRLPKIDPGSVCLLLGQQGSGKSFAAQALALEWYRGGGAVIICDPMGCFGGMTHAAGFVPVHEMAKPDFWPPETGSRPLLLVIDEVHQICRRGKQAPKWLAPLCAQVRHLRLSLLATSQHPAQVHRDLRTLATHVYASPLRGAEAIGWCRSGGLSYPKPAPAPRQFVRLR